MEGEKGKTSSSILIYLVSNFAINLMAAQQNNSFNKMKRRTILQDSLKGLH